MATKPQIKRAVKDLVAPRLKNLATIKKMNYHLFPQPIKSKIKGSVVYIAGVYERDGKYKWDGIAVNLKGIPDATNGVINKSKFDTYITKGKGVSPNATMLKKQGETYTTMLSGEADKVNAKQKADNKIVPDAKDLRKVSTYLKNNMKSIKQFYATWNKNNEMGITLPFTFKPTIAKFEQEGESEFHVDFNKGVVSTNSDSPKYDQGVGRASKEIGKFKDVKQLLSLIKRQFRDDKDNEISRFNDSERNQWHR
tara:strand:+ start:862 stop:1620 length:759 start_codon:yes stop_codon:yes gene_type:complete